MTLMTPALEIRTSSLVMWCLVLSSVTAADGSLSEVESILMMMSLLSLPTVTDLRDSLDLATSRTAAMTVV